MRSALSVFSLAGLIAAFFALPTAAHDGPNIEFGYGPKLPQGCTAVQADTASWGGVAYDLECTASVSDTVDFRIVIQIPPLGAESPLAGMAGYSFGAQWDTNNQNSLTVTSANQGDQTGIGPIDQGPDVPPVTVGYTLQNGAGSTVAPGGITQSRTGCPEPADCAGVATNWEALGASPDSSINILTAGFSFRAGSIGVTVDSTTGTRLQLGWYNSLQDTYVAGDATEATAEDMFFAGAQINDAPEPGAALAMLTGIASVALLARRARQTR